MKEEKFQRLVEEVSEFIADHDMRNRHPLTDEEVIKRFEDIYKPKHIRRALEEVR